MADDEKNPTEETAETSAEPETGAPRATSAEETEAAQEPAADEAVAEPATESPVRESGPVEGVSGEPGGPPEAGDAEETAGAQEPAATEAATQNPPRERKPKSGRHVPRSDRRQRSKPTREKPAERKPIVRGERSEIERGRRQERRGVVVSDKGDKTIVVKVDVIKLHPKYKKVVRRAVKFHAHDERNEAGAGDVVRIVETRPLSKTKHWRLAEIVEKAR
jgi:small subunit ribosomal protein S17